MEDKMGIIYRQYDVEVTGTYRIKGCTVLNTDKGELVIKPYEESANKALIDCKIKEHLSGMGFKNVDLIIPNKEGELISYNQYGNPFVIKKFLAGQECDLYNEEQVILGIKELARLHNALRNLDVEASPFDRIRKRDIKEEQLGHLRGIRRINRYIIDKRQKNEFEIEFLKLFSEYINQAELAVLEICDDWYEKAVLGEAGNRICHGSFNHHSIIFTQDKEGVITNFEKAGMGNQITDLYNFLRKTMEKNQWRTELGMRIIDTYVENIEVSKEDFKLLTVLLAFPEKFYKIANQYYNKRKVWIPYKNMQKINSLNEQADNRSNFIRAIREYRL